MPGDDHWLNWSNTNCPPSFIILFISKHWHYTLNTSKVNINNGRGYLLLTVWSNQCYYWRLQVVARLSDFYLRTWKKILYVLVKNILPLMCCYCCVIFSVGILFSLVPCSGQANGFSPEKEQIDTYTNNLSMVRSQSSRILLKKQQ